MVKQWKQSLEQSDILSDGTPFDGSNIDAPISSAGQGVDWGGKTPRSDEVFPGDTLTVNASGYLLSVGPSSQAGSFTFTFNITLDGTQIGDDYEVGNDISGNGTAAAVSHSFIHRFESKLEVTEIDNNGGGGHVTYVLD